MSYNKCWCYSHCIQCIHIIRTPSVYMLLYIHNHIYLEIYTVYTYTHKYIFYVLSSYYNSWNLFESVSLSYEHRSSLTWHKVVIIPERTCVTWFSRPAPFHRLQSDSHWRSVPAVLANIRHQIRLAGVDSWRQSVPTRPQCSDDESTKQTQPAAQNQASWSAEMKVFVAAQTHSPLIDIKHTQWWESSHSKWTLFQVQFTHFMNWFSSWVLILF